MWHHPCRNCLGQQLAKINVPTAVAMLTREFHLTLAPQVRANPGRPLVRVMFYWTQCSLHRQSSTSSKLSTAKPVLHLNVLPGNMLCFRA